MPLQCHLRKGISRSVTFGAKRHDIERHGILCRSITPFNDELVSDAEHMLSKTAGNDILDGVPVHRGVENSVAYELGHERVLGINAIHQLLQRGIACQRVFYHDIVLGISVLVSHLLPLS